MTTDVDVIGIGFGPGNIALAVAMDELDVDLSAQFFDRQPHPAWQPGMLLDGSDIQHNAARDLVLPRNPRSRYTFYNYLFETGRLFDFLNLGLPYPFRKDYAKYVNWVAGEFAHQVSYGAEVTGLDVTSGHGGPPGVVATLADGATVSARAVVVAPGRRARVPGVFADLSDTRVFHSSKYLHQLAQIDRTASPTIAVIGGSQSGVELVLDISRRWPQATVVNVIREFGHRQKDLSPFTNEVYFPEFTDYYYDLSEKSKWELDRQLRHTNYSAADIDVLHALYVRMYEDGLDGNDRVRIARNTVVSAVANGPAGIDLELTEVHRQQVSTLRADFVVLATGYVDLTDEHGGEFLPPMLADVAPLVGRTESGRAAVDRDYRLLPASGHSLPPIYLNGLCETTHGLGDAGSFSLLSIRSATIATSVGKELSASWPGSYRVVSA